jgi:lipoprotein Spr
MIRFTLLAFIALTVVACSGPKKTTRSDYPEFVWDDQASPVTIETNEEPRKPATSSTDKNLRAAIDEWLGTPYKWGGTTKEGADCSGFALRIYEEVYGKALPGRRVEDFLQSVEIVSKLDARPGDLVFFKIKGRRVDHVGIYLGNDSFVHASTSKGIIISSLKDAYYQNHFFKIGRPL